MMQWDISCTNNIIEIFIAMKKKQIYTCPKVENLNLGTEGLMIVCGISDHASAPARGVQHSNLGGSLGPSY